MANPSRATTLLCSFGKRASVDHAARLDSKATIELARFLFELPRSKAMLDDRTRRFPSDTRLHNVVIAEFTALAGVEAAVVSGICSTIFRLPSSPGKAGG